MKSVSDVLNEGQQLGLIGPGDVDAHIRHSSGYGAIISAFLPGEATRSAPRILDLGTGGGIPGLVIGVEHAEWLVTLLDGSTKRCGLLASWIAELDVAATVTVACGRAEELARRADLRGRFDVVVSRLFGTPAVTAECGGPFLRSGGLLVVSGPVVTGPEDCGERWSSEGVRQLGLEVIDEVGAPYRFTVLKQSAPCPERYPRRTGVPSKRPLF